MTWRVSNKDHIFPFYPLQILQPNYKLVSLNKDSFLPFEHYLSSVSQFYYKKHTVLLETD